MVETILVTGATGTVGSEVVKQLSQRKENIHMRAAIHTQNKADTLKQIIDNNQRIELADFNYNEPTSFKRPLTMLTRFF